MRYVFLYVIILVSVFARSQSFTEPSKLKQFNITVNYPDYTVKTQMLSHNKKLFAQSELTYMWYASQKIMETKGGFDGKLIHGFYRSFYLNNQLKEQGEIKYGLKNKVWKYWYSNGLIKESITWKKGKKNGVYCIYNDDGKLMAKSYFKDDKLNGKFYTHDEYGNILERKKYKNGAEVVKIPKPPKPIKQKRSEEVKPKNKKKKSKKETKTTDGTSVDA